MEQKPKSSEGFFFRSIFGIDLTEKISIALWLSPRLLLILILFVPAELQYSDVAAYVAPERLCANSYLVQSLLRIVISYYPISLYAFFLASSAMLVLIPLSFIRFSILLIAMTVFSFLPQFVSACS